MACLLFPRGAWAAERELIFVTLQLTAPDVTAAAARLRGVLSATKVEQVNFVEQDSVAATVRVPASEVSAFVEAVAAVGSVTRREFTRTDAEPQLADCARRQREVRLELDRLERAKANDADEAIRLADSVRQRRAEWSSFEDECRETADASERATVSIGISSSTPAPPRAPEPHFFPGVRFSHLFGASGGGSTHLLGLGLCAQFVEYLTFEVDLLRSVSGTGSFLDGLVMSAGFDTGSALLGRRRFLSPHLGVRLGVAALTGRVDLAAGVTAGLAIVRLQYFQLDAQVRLWGFFGNRDGAHLGVQSGLVAMVGF